MRAFLLIILCALASKDVIAEGENEVKRGTFPYMAFLYYPVETVLDNTGGRFMRGAVLITNDWLISSGDVAIAFPQKTLLARVGAINIDNKINFNEDEDEQEREIIVIIRPYDYNATEWWNADISLLKTLLPFNTTLSVSSVLPIDNLDNTEKSCFILIYAKQYDNATERNLIQMFVELLPSTRENCGSYFRKETMVCAADIEDKTTPRRDRNFCQGNSGGPLICDNKFSGLQTYISGCKPPHLYQLLTGWRELITCAMEEQYLSEPCADICVTLSKDSPTSERSSVATADNKDTVVTESEKVLEMIKEVLNEKFNNQSNDEVPTKTTPAEEESSANESEMLKSTIAETTEEQKANTTTVLRTSYSHDTTAFVSTEVLINTEDDALDSTENRERNNHIEAQHHLVQSDARVIIPSVFNHLMSITSILVCLTQTQLI